MQESANHKVHIVAFDVPYPPDYGGVIDVYYKIKALQQLGIGIILHCFTYKRQAAEELEEICEKVYYYKRSPMWLAYFSPLPMIIASRKSKLLLQRLAADAHPVLLEGLHTCGWLGNAALKEKQVVVRMHNNEHTYYAHLAQEEKNLFKRWYYQVESQRLAKKEHILSKASSVACIAMAETKYYQKKYQHAFYVGPFHGNDKMHNPQGSGEYVLYHGNLGINENNSAACYLVKEVFAKTNRPVIIAGNRPSQQLIQMARPHAHITIVANPSQAEMQRLIRDAHLHMLVTFQNTGVKLKLIQALFNGRFIVANKAMIEDTGLEKYVTIANTPEEQLQAMEALFSMEMDDEQLRLRSGMLNDLSDRQGARLIADRLFPGARPEAPH